MLHTRKRRIRGGKPVRNPHTPSRASEIAAERVRETRELRGLGQSELARRMEMSRDQLIRMERATQPMTLDQWLRFAHVLDIPPAKLLSPLNDGYAMITDGFGLSAPELRTWLVFGPPHSESGRLARDRIRFFL